jgi:hypothetical protein
MSDVRENSLGSVPQLVCGRCGGSDFTLAASAINFFADDDRLKVTLSCEGCGAEDHGVI